MAKSKLIRRVPSNIPPRGPFANANIQVVENAVNDIDDANVAPDAGIQRSKLADAEPDQVAFQYDAGSPFTVTSTTRVDRLNADQVDGKDAGALNGLATLDAGGKLVQDAKTLNGQRVFVFARDVLIAASSTKGSAQAVFEGVSSIDAVLATVQAHDLADTERPFDLALGGITTAGCFVSMALSANAAALRTVTVSLVVYGT